MPSLYEKYVLKPENLNTLSVRWKKAFEFTRKVLGDEELKSYSSINTAYPIAREQYIKTNVPREEWDRYLVDRNPIFSDLF